MKLHRSSNRPLFPQIRRDAFTLVELLVVIAIIAILAAMLMPVLNAAKQRSQVAVCLNNMRQLGLAFHMYATDNGDWVVYSNWGPLNHIQGWLYQGPQAAINAALTLPAPQKGPLGTSQACPPINLTTPVVQKFIYKANAFAPFVANAGVYWCPSQQATSKASQWFQNVFLSTPGGNTVSGNDIYSSYIMNGAINGFPNPNTQNPTDLQLYKLSNIHFRADNVILWEPEDKAGSFNDGSSKADANDGGEPSKRHVHGCVVLRLDGGTELQQYLYMLSQMKDFPGYSPTVPNGTHWNNEFFYAPGFKDGGYNEGNGASPDQ
ncbi:MAG TPA: prepilin-type N-terminal cleavage/methylation domain-containing protein [Verrucomicrobiae bacterium]|jgi:prepilin-type N-terminal cleavage/methylation domain-containing protein|nr:prepilin-type N-terminal cleavage/methylation domain-containing protein [Verrucomicrobiae bacterium]